MNTWTPTLPKDGKPHYLAIADAIGADIEAGELSSGDRLPPQRKLAATLGIDFTTVSRAYAEAQTRGLVNSHVGRGTFVAPAAKKSGQPDPERSAAEDLTMNMAPEPTDPALLDAMRSGFDYVGANLISLLRYQSAAGGERDKAAASTWLSLRGMVPNLDRIVVAPGAHAAMTAILSFKCQPGDVVLCERITYPGIRNIANRLGLRLEGIEMDRSGILPDALDAAIRSHGPKMVYLNPTLQNPTTITVPSDRRLDIAEVLNRHGLPLLEDDAYGFIPVKAPPPMALLAPELTWHVGGLAKCIGAGLRLAYTVAPSAREGYQLAQTLRALSVMPSPLTMALTTRWIEDGTADRIRRFVRAETAARQAIAAECLRGFDFDANEFAFNVWLRLPKGSGRAHIIAGMAGRRVGIMPSDTFTVTGTPDEHVRVCLGGAITREELEAGLFFLSQTMMADSFRG